MKITKKSVKASEECCQAQECPKKRASDAIKSAIEILTECPDDPICRDSIANLSVVILDLAPEPCPPCPECEPELGTEDPMPGVEEVL